MYFVFDKSEKKSTRMANKVNRFSLTEKELQLYSRQIMLKEIGNEGQLELKKKKACVIGLGGLGSSIARQLAAMGVGHIRIVDRDIVEISNLQRQHLYDTKVLGYAKAEIATKRLRTLNPYITLEPLTVSINSGNAQELANEMDVVVDGLDAMKPRYAINRACVKLGVPYVFGAAIMVYGNASTIIPYESPCLECFFGKIDDDSMQKCAVVGVHPSIINIISSIEVSETIKLLLGQEPVLKSKLLYYSLAELSTDVIKIVKKEGCSICGEQPVGELFPLKRELVEEVCGRGGTRTFIVVPKEDLKLNMSSLYEILAAKGFCLEVKGNLGITSTLKKCKVSILKSGVMITEGIGDKDILLKTYRDIINSLGISWSKIDEEE